MPIEFPCSQCGKLLRTPDDTAGRQAKCPVCGAVVDVPQAPTGRSPFGDAGPGSADAPNPYQSPAEYASPQFGGVQPTGVIRPTPIDLGDVFGRTWTVFKDQWGMCLVIVVVCWIINVVVGQIGQWGGTAVGIVVDNRTVGMVMGQFGAIAAQLFSLWIGIGQAIFFIKTARGQEASFGDILTGGPYFFRVLGASLLLTLGGLLIFAACAVPCLVIAFAAGGEDAIVAGFGFGAIIAVVPLIIYMLVFSQYYYLIIDHNARAIESLGLSRVVTRGNRATIFAIGVLAGIGGVLLMLVTCGLGLLAVLPFMALLYPVMYLAMTGQATAPAYPPAAATGPEPDITPR